MNHVAFRMPVLVLAVSKNLHKLLQNSSLTTAALLGELGRVMIMAIHVAVVLIVAVLGAKDGVAKRAGEVIDMVFPIQRCNVRSA
jgi:hypothetical protein